MNIFEDLKRFFVSEILVEAGRKPTDSEEDLIEQGIIDSLSIMKIIAFLEETYNIAIFDEEIIPEHFQTISNIVKFVEQKMQRN